MRKGQKMPDELRKHLSNIRIGRFKGRDNPHWRGGTVIVDGYRYIYSPDHPHKTQLGYVCEHRLVMEKILGRLLCETEAIHHLNHNRLDNRPKNLHLCISNGKHFIEKHLLKRDKLGRFHTAIKSISH